MDVPPGRSRRRSDAARSAERILLAARRLTGGSWSVEDVALEAGVGVATVYRHFTNRDRLVQTVAAHEVADRLAPHVAAATADTSARHGLHELAKHLVRLASEQADTATHEASAIAAILSEVTLRYTADIEGLLVRAQQAAEIRRDIDVDDIAPIIGAMLAGLTLPFGGRQAPERYIALIFDALDPRDARPLPPRPDQDADHGRRAAGTQAPPT